MTYKPKDDEYDFLFKGIFVDILLVFIRHIHFVDSANF